MATSGCDEGAREVSRARSVPPPQDPPGPVLDLWSLPPGALDLDEALMGDAAALDRLAAVLPVLGPDLEADRSDPGVSAPGRESFPDPVAPAGTGTRSAPRSRSEARAGARDRGRPGLSRTAVVLLLAVVYAVSVAVVLAWDAWRASGPAPAGRMGGTVIDGPPPCPMYRSPRSADAESSGACFFVG